MKKIVLLFSILLLAQVAFAADEIGQKYQKAYNLILDKKWKQGKALMQEIVDQNPDSKWQDDAYFWKCYALEKLERSPESSFECYQRFIENLPSSKWANDAQGNLVRLANKLQKAGNPEYKALLQSMEENEDREISLAALYALANRGDDRAFESVMKLYKTTKDPKIRKKSIYVLGSFDNPKAIKELVNVARNEKDSEIRQEAIFWLSQNHASEEVLKLLKTLIYKDPDEGIQKKALSGTAGIKTINRCVN